MNAIGEKINWQEKINSCRILEVKQLMNYLQANISKFWSWGASKFIVDNMKNSKMFRMFVRGHHHTGHVYIFLNGLDLFDVYIVTTKGTIKNIGEGLYFDKLVDWIDRKIEYIPKYSC